MTALTALLLADRSELEFDAPIALGPRLSWIFIGIDACTTLRTEKAKWTGGR
jgi:hypothetical protein